MKSAEWRVKSEEGKGKREDLPFVVDGTLDYC